MALTVQQLIGDRQPITVGPDAMVDTALDLMTRHQFSQLPVIDPDGRPQGMITSESVLAALRIFGSKPGELRVSHAMKKPRRMFHPEDDLFDLLDALRDTYAVLIVDRLGALTGIVTAFDTTEYFRQRTQDMMLVEDIEITLKDYILASYSADKSDMTDDVSPSLQAAIDESAGARSKQRKQFLSALQAYLTMATQGQGLNRTYAEEAYTKGFQRDSSPSFHDLTFAEYMELLLNDKQWPRYRQLFAPLEAQYLRTLLDNVREARNAVAHFREVTSEQHNQLDFCSALFANHPPARLAPPHTDAEVPAAEAPRIGPARQEADESLSPDALAATDEVIEPRDSRYAPLALFLAGQPREHTDLALSFSDVEAIIHAQLPPYARQHRAFWSNDTVSHVQSRQWLEVDWRVATVDMANEVVVFSRIKEREKQYIAFFSALMAHLRESAQFAIRPGSPDGRSWHTVAGVPEQGPQVAVLAFAFARNHRFRIELYIDTDDKERNKRIFDHLYARNDEVEHDLLGVGEWGDLMSSLLKVSMGWERLDGKRASRVALYCMASITDDEADRDLAIAWAEDATPRFQKLMNRLVTEAVQAGA